MANKIEIDTSLVGIAFLALLAWYSGWEALKGFIKSDVANALDFDTTSTFALVALVAVFIILISGRARSKRK